MAVFLCVSCAVERECFLLVMKVMMGDATGTMEKNKTVEGRIFTYNANNVHRICLADLCEKEKKISNETSGVLTCRRKR